MRRAVLAIVTGLTGLAVVLGGGASWAATPSEDEEEYPIDEALEEADGEEVDEDEIALKRLIEEALRAEDPAAQVNAPGGETEAAPEPEAVSPEAAPKAAQRAAAGARSALEAAVLDEMNAMRANPPAYAAKLARLRPYYDGTMLRVPGEPAVLTAEGVDALDEAIAILRRTGRRPALAWSAGLAQAARDHADDLGRHGHVGHAGSDGSTPDRRASRHGKWHAIVAENITFGSMTAEDVVIDLLVDDGVSDRGHRDVLLDRTLHVAGVACGPHPGYRRTCVIDYAGSFDDGPRIVAATRAAARAADAERDSELSDAVEVAPEPAPAAAPRAYLAPRVEAPIAPEAPPPASAAPGRAPAPAVAPPADAGDGDEDDEEIVEV